MTLTVGTSGYSYKEWKGPFYPEKIKPAEMLGFYAQRLSGVEINNTFYRLPKPSVLESWAAQVPESFRFSIKASRRITHFKRLKDAGDETRYLLETTRVLGERLGAVLFQLPPNLPCDLERFDLERFDRFLEILPPGLRAAFEFRHASWHTPPHREAVLARLSERDFALVGVDAEGAAHPELVPSSSWGYLRLRRPDYDRADLARWALEMRSCSWEQGFVFFKHEDAAAGPRLAADFLEVFEVVAGTRTARRAAEARPRREREAG